MKLNPVNVSQSTLSQQVASSIRSAILHGQFESASRLRQAVIADELGVSQATVREALLSLEQEGLVSGIPYSGYYVNKLSVKDVTDLFEMRLLLETYALEHPNEAVGPAVVRRLKACIGRMSECAKRGDQAGFIAGDIDFHQTVVSMAINPLVESLWTRMTPRVRLFMNGHQQLTEDMCEVADSHWTIVKAVEEGKLDEAQAALEKHLRLCSRVLGADRATETPD